MHKNRVLKGVNVICYSCYKASECPTFRKLYSTSKDFCINDCNDYDPVSRYKYKRIAENDNLMHLIYDYFTEQLEGYTYEEAKMAITSAMWNL